MADSPVKNSFHSHLWQNFGLVLGEAGAIESECTMFHVSIVTMANRCCGRKGVTAWRGGSIDRSNLRFRSIPAVEPWTSSMFSTASLRIHGRSRTQLFCGLGEGAPLGVLCMVLWEHGVLNLLIRAIQSLDH